MNHHLNYLLVAALAIAIPAQAMEKKKQKSLAASTTPISEVKVADLFNPTSTTGKKGRKRKKKNTTTTTTDSNLVANKAVVALVHVDKDKSPAILDALEHSSINNQMQASVPSINAEEQLKALVTGIIYAYQGFWNDDFEIPHISKTPVINNSESDDSDEEEVKSESAKKLKRLIKNPESKLEDLIRLSLAVSAKEGSTKSNQEIMQLILAKLNKKYGTQQIAEEKIGIVAKAFYHPTLPLETKVEVYYNDSKNITDNILTPLIAQAKDKALEKEKNESRQEAIELSMKGLQAENEELQLKNQQIVNDVNDAALVAAYFNKNKAENKAAFKQEYIEEQKALTELKENKAYLEAQLAETEKRYSKKDLAVQQKEQYRKQIQKAAEAINAQQTKVDDLKLKLEKIDKPGTLKGNLDRSGFWSLFGSK